MRFFTVVAICCWAAFPATEAKAPLPRPAKLPKSNGYVKFNGPRTLKKGEVFDGGMKTYDIGHTCEEQKETGKQFAAFIMEHGSTLKNAIIGKAQNEGVHCYGSCTLENVWWEDVCEDGLTTRSGPAGDNVVLTIKGGGAFNAEDKFIQNNGYGKIIIDNFYAENMGKFWKSGVVCKQGAHRTAKITNTVAKNIRIFATVVDCGDSVTMSNITMIGVSEMCDFSRGVYGKQDVEKRVAAMKGNRNISVNKFDGKHCIKAGPIYRNGTYNKQTHIANANASGKNYEGDKSKTKGKDKGAKKGTKSKCKSKSKKKKKSK